MSIIIFLTNTASFILSIILLVLAFKLVLRTEKKLDKMFKCLAVVAIALFLNSLAGMNNFFHIFNENAILLFTSIMRFTAAFFFVAAFYLILDAFDEECK